MKGIWLILLTLIPLITQAQETISYEQLKASRPTSQYTIKEWNMDSGLPNNAIMDIEQTEEGYLWLATYNGLTRFDGIEFEVFNRSNSPEFVTNSISALVVDDNNDLWVGTNGGGLLKYHQGEFTRYPADSINGSIITGLTRGADGAIWIGTRRGLVKFENGNFRKIDLEALAEINITSMHYDDQLDRLWVGSNARGVFVLDEAGVVNFSRKHGLKSNFIYSVFVDSRNQVWVGTDRGVALIVSSGIQTFENEANAPQSYTNSFLEDAQGNIWLGSKDGLLRYNQGFEKVERDFEVSHHVIQSLFLDEEMNIWAGTYRVGLSRINQSKFVLLGESEGLPNEVINVTYADVGKHWIGTDAGLICMEDGQMTPFSLDTYGSGNRIRDIYRDSKSRLWVCTYGGLIQFDSGKVVNRLTTEDGLCSNNTRRIVEDSQGNLWIGTANGLSLFQDGVFTTFTSDSGLEDDFIMSLYVDHTDRLWVGTNGGGSYVMEDGRFVKIMSQEASNDIVFNFVEDDNQGLWISTNRGVIYFKDSTEYTISVQHGLQSNNVFQVIHEKPGDVWFASDRGVMRANFQDLTNLIRGRTEKLNATRVFDRSDGLRTGQITPASITGKTSAGEIWFCTLKGVAVLDSEDIPTNTRKANTLISNIITDNNEYRPRQTIELPAGNRTLEIHYTGLSFSAPEKVGYRFRMINFDEYWVNAGVRRVAYYTNLPPGEYEFEVMAANNDGLWSEEPARFTVVQAAYFYQETWFYILLGITLIAFGAFLYYLRARGLSRRNYQLARMVQERTRDIQYQNEEIIVQKEELKQLNTVKDKLLSVISHDLRGPIAAVSGLLGLLKSGHLNYHELIAQSNRLNNEVHNLTYLLDNLLNWSKTQMQGIKLNNETTQLHNLVEQNLQTARPVSEQKKISVYNKIPEDCYVHADVNFLSLVIRNLVMNALKFTHEKGEITITCESHEDQVMIAVTDNGVGMSQEELEKLFNDESHYSKLGTAREAGTGIGLLLCKEFIQLDGGDIWAESEEGKGSSFKFLVKKGSPQPVEDNLS